MKAPHTVFQNRRSTVVRTFIVSLSLLTLVSIGFGPCVLDLRAIQEKGSMMWYAIQLAEPRDYRPENLVFDGKHIWVTHMGTNRVYRLNVDGPR